VPPSARGAARRRQILEATLRVIGRGGIAAVDHRTVAADAGVPLGSTTYYFDSKDDMVSQALHHVADEETERLARDRAELEGKTPAAVRRRLTDHVLSSVAADRMLLLAHYQLYLESARREELRPAAELWDAAYRAFYARALEILGAPDPVERAALLCVSLDGLILQHLARAGDEGELRERAEQIVALYGGG
jgi:DNA-binding transcriptional regulator YbjK